MMARAVLLTLFTASAAAFAPSVPLRASATKLQFGIPKFLTPDEGDETTNDTESTIPKKEVGLKGLVQLITAGAGAPFLGDFQGVDEETGKFMFSLEANNLVDENGNSKQTQAAYFENGWVDPEDAKKAAEGFKFPWQK